MAEVIALIQEAGRKGVAIPGYLRDEGFCTELVRRTVRELDGLDNPCQQTKAATMIS